MEHNSEAVEMGKIIHETSYERKRKEIEFEGIKIDFFDKNRGLIHEVKKSKAVEEAHIWQLKYYIYHLKKYGVEVAGKINYPLIRRTEDVGLSDEDSKRLENMLAEIDEIKKQPNPPPVVKSKICKSCSYYELCYI
jgi:CRISPR-associated exonuclease Cas4